MSDELESTEYGFRWGAADVLRYMSLPDGSVCIGIETNDKRRLSIYVSPAGRSVRVFENGHGELVAERNAMAAHINQLAEDWQSERDRVGASIEGATKQYRIAVDSVQQYFGATESDATTAADIVDIVCRVFGQTMPKSKGGLAQTLAKARGIDPLDPQVQRAIKLAEANHDLMHDLVKARLDQGLTQAQVGTRLGITQHAVSQFERYDSDPKLSTIRRYAQAIGATITHEVTSPSP